MTLRITAASGGHGVDTALRDIEARLAGVSLYDLLRGASREGVMA